VIDGLTFSPTDLAGGYELLRALFENLPQLLVCQPLEEQRHLRHVKQHPNQEFLIQFSETIDPDPSNHGEGNDPYGFDLVVRTDANGDASFRIEVNLAAKWAADCDQHNNLGHLRVL
jgi:hypothetical protein